jgi:hypothetical protein
MRGRVWCQIGIWALWYDEAVNAHKLREIAMSQSIHIKTKVIAGPKIEIPTPDHEDGDQVDVILVFPAKGQHHKRSIREIVASRNEPRIFETADEVDEFLRQERASWNR